MPVKSQPWTKSNDAAVGFVMTRLSFADPVEPKLVIIRHMIGG